MRMSSTLASIGAGLLALSSVAAGQNSEFKEEFSFTKSAASRQKLSVENGNGTVAVIGVPGRSDVRISGVKIVRAESADEQSNTSDITINISESGDAISVKTEHPDNSRARDYSVEYRIEVPSAWSVRVRNDNGSVLVEGIQKDVKVNVANGTVETKNITGDIDAEVANGTIRGNATVPGNGSCRLRTSNGTIDARLEMASSASCNLGADNGRITLTLPRGTSAGVSATAGIGSVSVDGLEFASKKSDTQNMMGETFTGTLGGGSGKITLAVQNGGIMLKGM